MLMDFESFKNCVINALKIAFFSKADCDERKQIRFVNFSQKYIKITNFT